MPRYYTNPEIPARSPHTFGECLVVSLENCDGEFTVQEVSEMSAKILKKRISPSQISQMFSKLSDAGLVYKNRHGKYVFAVPLLGQFVKRQMDLPNGG